MGSPGRHPLADLLLGVRMRTTVVATAIVAVALAVGAVLLVQMQESILTDDVDNAIDVRADEVESRLERDDDVGPLDVANEDEALVQILDGDGQVVAASDNVTGDPPVADVSGIDAEHIETVDGLPIDPDERFRLRIEPIETGEGRFTIIVAGSLEPIDENLAALTRNLLLALPVLVVVVGLTTWIMVGRALRPVDAIRAEVDTITDERLDRRVPEPRANDEVGKLARTMNVMLGRLQAAWVRQERFVADASHELRSPLTAMRSQLEVDREHPDTADRQRTEVELLEQVEQLQRLIDDLLFLARSDADAPRTVQALDLDDLVLKEVARQRPVTSLDIDTSAVSAGQVDGNARDLQRLVRNLLDNALRHAQRRVAVSLSENGQSVELTVADDGPGIPTELREQIFERFTRLDDARAHGEGSGLGLAIADDIVRRHGGTIAVDPDMEVGARLLVHLPRSGASALPAR